VISTPLRRFLSIVNVFLFAETKENHQDHCCLREQKWFSSLITMEITWKRVGEKKGGQKPDLVSVSCLSNVWEQRICTRQKGIQS
jgi:hypothetical protein